jgi:uncharacterized protein (UPF0179 family)
MFMQGDVCIYNGDVNDIRGKKAVVNCTLHDGNVVIVGVLEEDGVTQTDGYKVKATSLRLARETS